MSYLLTEIALEMLGFSFFDVDGDAQDTNFQTSGPLDIDRRRRSNADETNLEKLLSIPPKMVDDEKEHLEERIISENTIEKSPIKIEKKPSGNVNEMENEVIMNDAETINDKDDAEAAIADSATNAETSITAAVQSTASAGVEENSDLNKSNLNKSTLSKLLMFEQRRIVNQVLLNRKNYVRETLESSKISDKSELSASNFMKPFILSETQKLKDEVENMTKFRETVEQILSKSSSKNYEKYLRTFNRSILPKDNNN